MKTRILSLVVALFATITLQAYQAYDFFDFFYFYGYSSLRYRVFATGADVATIINSSHYASFSRVSIPYDTEYEGYFYRVIGIGTDAFSNCVELSEITIPWGISEIGIGAFSKCPNLTSIVVEEGNEVFDSRNNCNAIIKTSTNTLAQGCKTTIIPNSVTSIGLCAFDSCTGLTSITIPNSVTSIGFCAFANCTGLTSITIPNSVTSIGVGAFYGCKNIETIVFGNNVDTIGGMAFSGCSKIYKMTIYATTVPTIEEYTFEGVSERVTLYVPKGCVEKYKANPYWGVFNVVEMGGDTGVNDIKIKNTPKKFIYDGQVLIQHNDKTYTASGMEIKH